MMEYVAGQRWLSETEPELGLGTVVQVEPGRVQVLFTATGEMRAYASESAPLQRVRFGPGDRVRSHEAREFVVSRVTEEDGRLVYRGEREGQILGEAELADTIDFQSPDRRLRAGAHDSPEDFSLRRRALEWRSRSREAEWRGFIGGRIELLPHQLYVAREASSRPRPRVLLADEVGLGKTIEAGLVLHRLLRTGRSERALILVPESLVHQWFVELLRRFHLNPGLLNEEACEAAEADDPGLNPFAENALVIAPLKWLVSDPRRATQALTVVWDLVIVDEAHHLGWTEAGGAPDYRLVEALGRRSFGLLLLTATPEQLGEASHFARLRLLDPDRFGELARFQADNLHFRKLARLAKHLLSGARLDAADHAELESVLAAEPEVLRERLERFAEGDAAARESLLEDLLDRHGPGRVMFRNTRAGRKGFPRRLLEAEALEIPPGARKVMEAAWLDEFESDMEEEAGAEFVPDWDGDPRFRWLAGLLESHAPDKFLLICRSRSKVEALAEVLAGHTGVGMGVFHEGMTLIQRDRQAAWFADPDGARLLLCSEIGGEGRNFQFAQHLVLFDLPGDPELLEQRIGRLDRIGQKGDIHLHVPVLPGTAQEVFFRWYAEGLGAFQASLHAARPLFEALGPEALELARQRGHEEATDAEVRAFIKRSRDLCRKLTAQIESGRDRLLELASCRPEPARQLVKTLEAVDRDDGLEAFLLDVFERFGVQVEELGPRIFRLDTRGLNASFPGMDKDELVITLDRKLALSREEIPFVTWDHPLATGGLDLVLGGETGNCAVGRWNGPEHAGEGFWVEALFVVECLAPLSLHADRFLPPRPVRVLVDAMGRDITAGHAAEVLDGGLVSAGIPRLPLERVEAALGCAREGAETHLARILQAAGAACARHYTHEIDRLRALGAVNPAVDPGEIRHLEEEFEALALKLGEGRLRLDAFRVILFPAPTPG